MFSLTPTIIALIAEIAAEECNCKTELEHNLGSNTSTNQEIDLVITDWRTGIVTSFDLQISCPLTPNMIRGSRSSANYCLTRIEQEKDHEHKKGCLSRDHVFIPIAMTTGGSMGGRRFWRWLDTLFGRSIALEKLAGGTGWDAACRKIFAQARINALLARANADTMVGLQADAVYTKRRRISNFIWSKVNADRQGTTAQTHVRIAANAPRIIE